jgi:O6-methylguanine-DNA--protein-cysteine methyltransferase
MPKAETFQAFMKRKRTRLQKARDKAAHKKAEVSRELEALERELTAIEAYDKATGGKAKPVAKRPRSRTGEKRQAVLEIVSQHPDGLSRGEILNLIGVKGEQSVSNALSALTKQNQLGKKDGKYVPA